MSPLSLQTPPNRGNHQQLRLMAGVVALAALLGGCGKGDQPAGPGKMGGMPPMPVTVIEARSEHIPTLIEAVGQAESSKVVEVHASVGGYLTQQLYSEGGQVKAGATLFTIDRATFDNSVSESNATVALNKATLEKAEREVTRLKPLVEEKAVSQRELDDANTALKSAQAALQASEARRQDAELYLSYTNVTSPITGIAGRALLQPGRLISQGTSPVLTTVHAIDPLWVRFSFSESETMQLRKAKGNRDVTLILADGSSYGATGKINFSASTVDTKTGMVQMRAAFPNPDHLLLPGQFVRVQVSMGEREAYLIPQAALAQTDKGDMLFTVTLDNKVAPRPVESDGWSGHNWVVTKGLTNGDKVIIDNLMKLRPGAAVMPHAPGEMPAPPAGTKQ